MNKIFSNKENEKKWYEKIWEEFFGLLKKSFQVVSYGRIIFIAYFWLSGRLFGREETAKEVEKQSERFFGTKPFKNSQTVGSSPQRFYASKIIFTRNLDERINDVEGEAFLLGVQCKKIEKIEGVLNSIKSTMRTILSAENISPNIEENISNVFERLEELRLRLEEVRRFFGKQIDLTQDLLEELKETEEIKEIEEKK